MRSCSCQLFWFIGESSVGEKCVCLYTPTVSWSYVICDQNDPIEKVWLADNVFTGFQMATKN